MGRYAEQDSNPGVDRGDGRQARGRLPLLIGLVILALAVTTVAVWTSTSRNLAWTSGDQFADGSQTVMETDGKCNQEPPDASAPGTSSNGMARQEHRVDVQPRAESPAAREDPPAGRIPRNVRELVVLRKHYDESVWAKEVLTQRYMQTFVRLWDGLIWRGDKYQVLRDFAFEKLLLGQEVSEREIDWAVRVKTSAGRPREISAAHWTVMLARVRDQGFRIIESEWHHLQFEPPTDGQPVRSVIGMALHVDRPSTSQRFILRSVNSAPQHDPLWVGEDSTG